MRLISAAKVAKGIGFDEGVQEDVFAAAVITATSSVASMLRTQFDRAAVVDQFYVLPNQCLPFSRQVYRTRLALSRGFIHTITGLTYGSSIDELVEGSGVLVENRYVTVNLDKGEVVVTGPDLRDRFLSISYVAGFEEEDGTYKDIPAWLEGLAETQALIQIDTIAPTLRYEDNGAERAIRVLRADLEARAADKIRYFPNAVRPIG